MSSDDESEVASEHEEELEEATLEEEPIDVDQTEVASEHSLESVTDLPKYSSEDPSWIEISSDDDSDEDMAEDDDKEVFDCLIHEFCKI